MNAAKEQKYYEDITEKWLKNSKLNSCNVMDSQYFRDRKDVKYYVDGKKVVLDYSIREKEIAEWLVNIFGGKIYMLPRINHPEGVKTADYWFKGDYYDLKETTSSKDMAIDYAVKKSHSQSHNFIIDITGNPLKIQTIIRQIEKVYQSPRRNWVNIIILKKDNTLLGVFQRKKN